MYIIQCGRYTTYNRLEDDYNVEEAYNGTERPSQQDKLKEATTCG